MQRALLTCVALVLMLVQVSAFAQVSAAPPLMNFQGRLARPDGTPVANGSYSIRFSFWTAQTGGTEKWNQTLNPVTVRNGTFAVLLSGFPAGTFNTNLFLEIKIGSATPLTPRQQLVSVAYAMKANAVLDGSITTNSLAANAVTSAKIADGTITSADIANGTITNADLAAGTLNPLAWLLNGNSGATSGFLGTTDNQPLEFRVNGRRAMRYSYVENTAVAGEEFRTINVLGGSEINEIGSGVVGATIAGGGLDSFSTTDEPNRALADFGTVGGGLINTVRGSLAVVAGGYNNSAEVFSDTVGGGNFNLTHGGAATVGGGSGNTASASYATVAGGAGNVASGGYAMAAGGSGNTAHGDFSTVGGGYINTASGECSIVAGGYANLAAGFCSFAAGNAARAYHDYTFVWSDNAGIFGIPFNSTGPNQFLISAVGGVGINTNNPTGATLSVSGGRTNVGVFAGNRVPFGTAAFESNLGSGFNTSHIWCANNGTEVFYVLGDGSVYGTGAYHNLSDARYKTHIKTVTDALETILSLHGVTFEWDREKWKDYCFPEGRQIGFVAQEVEQVLPELVSTGKNGYKSVAYSNVVPVLVEAIKEQQKQQETDRAEIRAVKAENTALKQQLSELAESVRQIKTEHEKRRANAANK